MTPQAREIFALIEEEKENGYFETADIFAVQFQDDQNRIIVEVAERGDKTIEGTVTHWRGEKSTSEEFENENELEEALRHLLRPDEREKYLYLAAG